MAKEAVVGEPPFPDEKGANLADRYHSLFEQSLLAKYTCDPDGTVHEVNPALCRLLGVPAQQVIGGTLASFSADPPLPAAELAEFLAGREPNYSAVRRYRAADGRVFRAIVTLGAERDHQGRARTIFGEIVDLSSYDDANNELSRQREELAEALETARLFDPLTRLPNRALLLDRLSGAIKRLSRSSGFLAVLFIDVDRFKQLNDSMGNEAGDEFLAQLGQRLRSVLRPADTVARLGADEFVVLCEALEAPREAMAVATRIEGVFVRPFKLGPSPGRDIYSSAAIGIALVDVPASDAQALVRDAAAAMHRAKEHGGGHAELFDAEVRRRSVAHFETESDLRRALEHGELCVYYQPVVDLTGKVAKVEALVRWVQPTGRVALPSEFVPVAEQTGLIVPLGEMVLHMACEQVGRWRTEHAVLAELGVSVNLSNAQLRLPDAVERIERIVASSGLPAHALVLEITESLFMDERAGAPEKLAELRTLGARLAVDDFGTGYSSLLYLRRLPLDFLKIDRSFVAGLASNPEDATIVDAVVSLGHSFGLQIVAEGVETADQLLLLQGLGCDLGQGHLWSRPLPPEKSLALLLSKLRPAPQPPSRDLSS